MTIRFLRQWNGYDDQDVVTLSAGEETRLVNAGLATGVLPNPYLRAGGGLRASLTNEIGLKHVGSNVGGAGGAGNTWCSKVAAPGDFDAVRVVIYHTSASATTLYQSIVAVTDTLSQATDVDRWRPVVAGSEYSVLSANDNYGWKPVTWAGAASFTSAAGSATVGIATVSDWIPLNSVPRADGSKFPLIHIRTSATGGTTSFGGQTNVAGGMQAVTAANGGFIIQSGWGADATGLQVTAPATNNPVGAMSSHSHSFGLQFRTRKPGISLIGIGDSLTQTSVVVADGLSSLGLRAAAAISATGTPCGFINAGMASYGMDVFTAVALDLMTKLECNAVLMQGMSPNGPTGFNTDPFMRDSIRKQAALVRSVTSAARGMDAACFISTAIPFSAALVPATSQDAYRVAYNNDIRNQAENFVDFDSLVTDGATPARIKAEYQYDVTHPNEGTVALESALLVSNLRNYFVI